MLVKRTVTTRSRWSLTGVFQGEFESVKHERARRRP
jgi:hypothetical protein